MWLCHGIHREYTRLYGQPQPLGDRTSPDRRSEDQISIGSTASTVLADELQEPGLEAARSHRNRGRWDNRMPSRPSPPRLVDDGPRIGIHQIFAYVRAEEARNSQNNDELIPADRSTADEQAVAEDADDLVRPELPLLSEDQVFDGEYADTDSLGHSDDDACNDDAPSTVPSSDNAPSLTQTTTESGIDKSSGLDAPEQLEPLSREFLDADADDEDEEPSPPRKKQKRVREDTSRVDEEERPRHNNWVKKQVKESKKGDE
jgi:hypothetical protein